MNSKNNLIICFLLSLMILLNIAFASATIVNSNSIKSNESIYRNCDIVPLDVNQIIQNNSEFPIYYNGRLFLGFNAFDEIASLDADEFERRYYSNITQKKEQSDVNKINCLDQSKLGASNTYQLSQFGEKPYNEFKNMEEFKDYSDEEIKEMVISVGGVPAASSGRLRDQTQEEPLRLIV